MGFLQKIGRMLQEDFSPPFDGFFFLKLVLYLAFFTFCLRLFGGGSCLGTTPEGRPEGRIIRGPIERPSAPAHRSVPQNDFAPEKRFNLESPFNLDHASLRTPIFARIADPSTGTPLAHGVL